MEVLNYLIMLVLEEIRINLQKTMLDWTLGNLSFVNRIVDVWNMLDKETVCSRNLHNFKHKLLLTNLSRYLKGRAYK